MHSLKGVGSYKTKTSKSRKWLVSKSLTGFTIVELLVVIVIIAILATITAVSYTGVSQRANIASIQQQLSNNSSLLKLYNAEYNSYPTALDANNCPSAPTADTKYCLKNMTGATLAYTGTTSTFYLTISKSGLSYKTTETGSIAKVISCPTGFIVVPGSTTYGTSDFCVMKYEAKNDGSNKAISVPGGYPWVNISQTSAITTAQAACSNCHLITEAEWMTIAQNVLSVQSNWSTGTVGSGFIYSGHNDFSSYALAADANDANGYFGTGNSSSSGANQRRTLTLSNGEVIWDMAGNVWEWTAGQTTGGQPGITGETGFTWKEWKNITANGSLLVNASPSGTGIAGANNWTAVTNGIGGILSYVNDTSLRGLMRGGFWRFNEQSGILALATYYDPSYADSPVGFRVTSAGL